MGDQQPEVEQYSLAIKQEKEENAIIGEIENTVEIIQSNLNTLRELCSKAKMLGKKVEDVLDKIQGGGRRRSKRARKTKKSQKKN